MISPGTHDNPEAYADNSVGCPGDLALAVRALIAFHHSLTRGLPPLKGEKDSVEIPFLKLGDFS